MSLSLITLFSVLAFATATLSNTDGLTSTEAKVLDNLLESDFSDIERYFNAFVEEGKRQLCQHRNFNLEIPLEATINRFEEVSREDLGSLTVCTILKTKLIYVTEPLVNAIDNECLNKDITGAADFIAHATLAAVEQICAFTGQEILELFNPCYLRIDFAASECLYEANIKINEDTTYIKRTFKEALCSGYTDIRPCFKEEIAKKCKLPITLNSGMTFLDTVLRSSCPV